MKYRHNHLVITHESVNEIGKKKIYNIEVTIDGETVAERWVQE